jgi:hypothetical protein
LRQRQPALDALGVAVLVATFEAEPAARAYVEETALPWPLLLDPSRVLYRAYGMGRGRWWAIWGPATWWTYARLVRRGHRPRRRPADVRQLGGDVLIGPDAVVRVHHVGTGPADRPPVDALLRVVRARHHPPS